LLLGQFGPGAEFLAGVARDGEKLVGHAWAGWGLNSSPIGVVAGVVTDEHCRGRGIASALVAELCQRFDMAGGTLLFLGTTNPEARRIYERLGFRELVGSVYRRGEFSAARNFAPGLPTRPHAATWRDMGSILPLYLLPHPCMVMDAAIELPSTRLFAPWRCFRIFWESWQSVGDAGSWELLENSPGWTVASALARPRSDGVRFLRSDEEGTSRCRGKACLAPTDGHDDGQAGFSVDFVWHPDYSDVGLEFVRDFLRRMEERNRGGPCLFLCDRDTWKIRAAKALGFSTASRAARHMLVSGERWALDEYRRD